MTQRAFKNVRGGNAENTGALPVDEFMASLEALQAEVATAKNEVWPRVADGTLSLELLKRLCKEYYFLGKWYTCEFGSIVSSAAANCWKCAISRVIKNRNVSCTCGSSVNSSSRS